MKLDLETKRKKHKGKRKSVSIIKFAWREDKK